MITCTILKNGDLKITADNYARSELNAMRQAGKNYWSIMAEAFESYSCNGSYAHFDAGQGEPFVGLTSAPCIAESLSYLDDGTIEIDGRVWWLSDYATRDDLGDLITKGRTVYHFGFDQNDKKAESHP